MWCIPTITPLFVERMEDILTLYAKPYNKQEPVLCFDEKSKQLLSSSREHKNCREGAPRRVDYEYVRHDTVNIFMIVEPRGGYRTTQVTNRRTKRDFARAIKRVLALKRYSTATKIHIVLDNLNTHFKESLYETYEEEAEKILQKIQFHYTPTHASWLNMAEIELSVMERQCTKQRIQNSTILRKNLALWKKKRNNAHATINWKFTVDDARKVFKGDEIK